VRPPSAPSRLAETEPFEPVVECLLAWPLDSPEFEHALAQSTKADRDEAVRRLGIVREQHEYAKPQLRRRLAELERDYPGIGNDD
jgi:hypothetical protein